MQPPNPSPPGGASGPHHRQLADRWSRHSCGATASRGGPSRAPRGSLPRHACTFACVPGSIRQRCLSSLTSTPLAFQARCAARLLPSLASPLPPLRSTRKRPLSRALRASLRAPSPPYPHPTWLRRSDAGRRGRGLPPTSLSRRWLRLKSYAHPPPVSLFAKIFASAKFSQIKAVVRGLSPIDVHRVSLNLRGLSSIISPPSLAFFRLVGYV